MNYQNINEKRIEKMFHEKQKRIQESQSRTQRSIAFFNSVNAAISLLGNKATKKKIQEWRDWFYQEWMSWAINNIIPDETKLTKEDFIQSKIKSPKRQAEQREAEEVGKEKEQEENEREANEVFDIQQGQEETFEPMSIKDLDNFYEK